MTSAFQNCPRFENQTNFGKLGHPNQFTSIKFRPILLIFDWYPDFKLTYTNIYTICSVFWYDILMNLNNNLKNLCCLVLCRFVLCHLTLCCVVLCCVVSCWLDSLVSTLSKYISPTSTHVFFIKFMTNKPSIREVKVYRFT